MIPKLGERDTCACIKHSNLHFKVIELKKRKLLKTDNLSELIDEVACDPKSKRCMYNECPRCKDLTVSVPQDNLEREVSWLAWNLKKIKYMKRTNAGQEEKYTQKYVKEVVSRNLGDLIKAFNTEMKKFRTHFYNITHQYTAYKTCIENLRETEAAIICDFSENYVCKHHTEIQAMHFGGSKNLITLHTGMLYTSKKNLYHSVQYLPLSSITQHPSGLTWTP